MQAVSLLVLAGCRQRKWSHSWYLLSARQAFCTRCCPSDANGVEKKNIEFDQYVYYEAVKCNRQDYSRVEDPQNGVNHYNEWGCGDLADLNCDTGKQWLALYTVKSPKKGDPILADSLKLQTGSNKLPANCTAGLHLFTYDSYVDIADEAYCYEPGKKLYFFWKSSGASETSSYSPAALQRLQAWQASWSVRLVPPRS